MFCFLNFLVLKLFYFSTFNHQTISYLNSKCISLFSLMYSRGRFTILECDLNKNLVYSLKICKSSKLLNCNYSVTYLYGPNLRPYTIGLNKSWRCIHIYFQFSYCNFIIKVWKMYREIKIACRNCILLPKLFWPTVRKNCSSDREKLWKFEA